MSEIPKHPDYKPEKVPLSKESGQETPPETIEKTSGTEGKEDPSSLDIAHEIAKQVISETQLQTITIPTQEYVAKHLPEYLREPSVVGNAYIDIAHVIFKTLERFGKFHIEGKENIPQQGPCLLVANHTRFFDETKISIAANRPVKIVGADMHFNSAIKRFFVKQLGVIEVPGTLSKLTKEEKIDLLKRAPKDAHDYYKHVIERDKKPLDRKKLTTFLETIVASLANGDPVVFFPEGLWTYEGHILREAYSGIEAITRRYKKQFGEDVPIIPIGITDQGLKIDKPMILSKEGTVHDVMKRIAELLPEEAHGFYKK